LIVPLLESAETVDMRVMVVETPTITVTILERQTVNVSVICLFQVGDAKKAVTRVTDAKESTSAVLQTVLRSVLGNNDLQTLQSEQKNINKTLKSTLEKQTREWGLTIKSVEIKELLLVPAAPQLPTDSD